MTAEESLRWLAYEAAQCRDRDAHEAFCLLLPALLNYHGLEPMDGFEALDFTREFKAWLRGEVLTR